ncbi:HIT domain-containing protein [Candidatus Aerophobetes bacterium]|uniref:HIT domain-containing protein n=1 Tax=Aerophobetes bacterium TaxID=2030807 RepID=A0A523Y2U6_UNCAE|nr:MAG: HIT domain-containing protein [Candidatus Aerophobetes bacterium]
MRRIWAPWRLEYILDEKKKGCIFCEKSKESKDVENYILLRGEKCLVMLNAFPYNNGHLMIIPYRHVGSIEDLKEDETREMMKLLSLMTVLLKKVMSPDGFNVGMNLGDVAGAGIMGHLHLHIVPRWKGDCNFMPVLSDTKVIPEALRQTYQKLKEGIDGNLGE